MIPSTTYLSENDELIRTQLMENYESMADAVNGRIESWTPTLFGNTIAGTPTYAASSQKGLYYIRGVMADIWFWVTWATAGGATGDIMVNLPLVVSLGEDWVFPTVVSAITLSANYTTTALEVINDTSTAKLYEVSNAIGSVILPLKWDGANPATSGTLYGNIRCMVQRDLSRR